MLKWIGALLIVGGCGAVGFSLAAGHKREEGELRQFMGALDFMQCELQYRLTPLPDLCRQAAAQCAGEICRFFTALAEELEDQLTPDVSACVRSALGRTAHLPDSVLRIAGELGKTLGRFDLDGQIHGLEKARQDCRREQDRLGQNRETRLRSYQTLSLCTGAALAILFL